MSTSSTLGPAEYARSRGVADGYTGPAKSLGSAVSWGAIAAGAAAAAALSLILLILGMGLGLSSVSPWARDGISAAAFGVSTIVWLTLTQLLASALGGYLAGRLRVRWADLQADEVYFRDTAHGFLAWAVSSLATAALLSSVIGSIVSGGVQAGATVAGGMGSSATAALGSAAASSRSASDDESGVMGYFVDALFRREPTPVPAAGALAGPAAMTTSGTDIDPGSADRHASEVARIFMNVSLSQPLPPEDIRYVAQLVAERTGLSQADAEKRVVNVYAKAQARIRDAEIATRDGADRARKASAYSAIWLFVSLLVGAFVASLAATFGGRRRDA